ncbi:MAG TPA: chromate transporter [Thermoclostridium sp.]|nr:chromate transporter [Thermoclostridium sp.]
MIYLQLFWSFFRIEFFTFGGGYAAIPLIKNVIVDENQWITLADFTDLITISEMTPGPIAVNSATFVGMQIAGPLGAIVSTIGCVLPSIIFVFFLSYVFLKFGNLSVIQGILGGLRPAVVGLIAQAGLSILVMTAWGIGGITLNISNTDIWALIIFFACLFVMRKFKPNPIYIMAGSGILSLLVHQFA